MIEYYQASTYRSFTGRPEDIEWSKPFDNYKDALERPYILIPEDGLSVYAVLDRQYIFACEPYKSCYYSRADEDHPCNIIHYEYEDDRRTIVQRTVFWEDFINDPYFFTKYATLVLDKPKEM